MTLNITINSAKLLKDFDTFTKMDPYVIVEFGDQKFTTKTIVSGGKDPVFGQSFTFNIEGKQQQLIVFKMWDKDILKDEFIGKFETPMKNWMASPGHPIVNQINLINGTELIGILNLGYTYILKVNG